MKLIIFLTLIALSKSRVIDDCSGIVVHGINHEKEILKSGLDTPYQLAIDYDTNTLFFSYSTPDDQDGFKSAYINLKNNEFGIIQGIQGGFASAVDWKNHIVYLGGHDGVYVYDFESKKAKHLGANEFSIWQLFHRNKLHFTNYPSEDVYTFENGVVTRVPELSNTKALLLAIDNNDNYVYCNSSGLFIYKKDKAQTNFLGEYQLNSFSVDMNKNLYFSTPDAIYAIDESGQQITKLADFPAIYGMAIEVDNSIIYADESSVIRLKPTKTKCFSDGNNNL